MKSNFALFILPALSMIAGCRDAGTNPGGARPDGSGIYVVNEGGFGGGGALSFIDPAGGAVAHDVIVNAGGWLFPNDILVLGERMYVAVNGSDLVAVVDPSSDSVVSEIAFTPGRGPGFLVREGGRIFTANYDGTVSALDPVAGSVILTSSRVVGFPGAILAAGGRIFVSDLGAWPDTGTNVMVLDPHSLGVLDSVAVGGGPAGMAFAGGKVYVGTAVSRAVWKFDPLSGVIEDSVRLDAGPGDLATDGVSLFVLTSDAVERIALAAFERDTTALFRRTTGLYHYAMGYDPNAGTLCVSTITGGGGAGEVSIHTTSGSPVGSPYPAGVFPGAFGSYRPEGR